MNHILRCYDIVKTDFVHAENCSLFDSQGKRYVDFEAGCWSTALGHNHPRINDVMRRQLGTVTHLGLRYPNQSAEEAALAVLDLLGMPNGKCFFLSSGSEAVAFAFRAARHFSGKPRLLAFSRSYFGAYNTTEHTDTSHWQLIDWSRCPHTAPCDCWEDIAFEDLGGFAFEPGGSGSESVKFPSAHLVQRLERAVKKAGGVVVVNEITTGMGRTGKWFGFQHYDIQPDIVAIGKGLGNGYPVSAVAMTAEVADRLERTGFHYAQSHQNDPMGCTVAKEVIAVMDEEGWIERGNATGEFFLAGLKDLAQRHAIVKEARGRGMLLALELHPHPRGSVEAVYRALLDQGFLVDYRPDRHFLRFDPALTIERGDIARLLESLDAILSEYA